VVGALKPNDGKCHMSLSNEGDGIYQYEESLQLVYHSCLVAKYSTVHSIAFAHMSSLQVINPLAPNTNILALVLKMKVILRKIRIMTHKLGFLLLHIGSTYSFVVCIELLTKDSSTISYNFCLLCLFRLSFKYHPRNNKNFFQTQTLLVPHLIELQLWDQA